MRFESAVSGTLRVDVATTGYDPILVIWNAPSAPLDTTQFASMLNQDCNGVRGDAEESLSGLVVQANRPVHIETLGFCGRASYWVDSPGCTGPPNDDLDAHSPGGPTSVSLTFQCTNGDGDDVCDTLDPCPALAGAQSGCPDRDRDGTLDAADGCPDVAGTDAACPADQDEDGIANATDQCETQKGYLPSGCPDGDSDNVFFPADACPTSKGIVPDGCPDGDGDGLSDLRDACATVFGASATGCLAVLGAGIRWDFKPGRSYKLRRLQVKTQAGARIELRCSSARRSHCPFMKRTFTATAAPRDFKSLFRDRSLRGRTFTLVFRVTKRGYSAPTSATSTTAATPPHRGALHSGDRQARSIAALVAARVPRPRWSPCSGSVPA